MGVSQTFRIWLVPFYAAPVDLVTVLRLKHDQREGKYYIDGQNDLYQVDQFVRFVWLGGWILVRIWQVVATGFCVLGAVVLWPVSVLEEWVGGEGKGRKGKGVDGDSDLDLDGSEGIGLR